MFCCERIKWALFPCTEHIYIKGLVNHPYLHEHKFLLHKSTVSNIRLKLGYIKIFDLLNGG